MPESAKLPVEYPLYIKIPAILISICLICFIFKTLEDVFIPLAFAVLISILLNPLCSRLQKRVSKVPAILISILLGILFLVGLFYFMSTQISGFLNSLPQLKIKLVALLGDLQVWVQDHFGVDIRQHISSLSTELRNGGLTSTVGTMLGTLGVVILIPIYVFMLLYYKPLILDFLFQVFSEKHSLRVAEVLTQTKSAVQSFMVGLLIETAIVCVLNSIALLAIGVPSAIVIGIIGGLLNILPYIGGLIAITIPVLMITVVRDGYTGQLLVIAAYLIIQFIDNNILVPRIVSSKVQINALISIIIVLLGGLLWGISGMFLSIPFVGVLKIIFDRVDDLKPWGRLLGDEVPSEHSGVVWQKRWDRIFRRMQQKKEIELRTGEGSSPNSL